MRAKQDNYFEARAELVFRAAKHVSEDADLLSYADKDSLGDAVFISTEQGESVTLVVERSSKVEYLGRACPSAESEPRHPY
ncbi:hypothetical protein [Cryobacterium melibiosiphilum]|uniref:hypothetical protein n=1 Tax=Cryobacterium melibiosiphilum TaxID=995039 RepID=UPI0011C2303E|nr:hypothetical protein [Cryobacterium melibiosiphilum]